MAETTPELAAIIRRFCEQIERMNIHWERVLLFGSQAQQRAQEGSDIDLFIVSPDWASYSDRERREVLGIAAARILEPIQASGVTPIEIATHQLSPFWEQMLKEAVVVAERTAADDETVNPRVEAKSALLYIPDLFFATRVADALKHLGFTTRDVDLRGDLATELRDAMLLVVQLDGPRTGWLKLIETARAAHLPVLAFGRHTEAETLRAARRAGATKAVPNSELAEALPQFVEQVTEGKIRRGE